jgi:hypothetical protein
MIKIIFALILLNGSGIAMLVFGFLLMTLDPSFVITAWLIMMTGGALNLLGLNVVNELTR